MPTQIHKKTQRRKIRVKSNTRKSKIGGDIIQKQDISNIISKVSDKTSKITAADIPGVVGENLIKLMASEASEIKKLIQNPNFCKGLVKTFQERFLPYIFKKDPTLSIEFKLEDVKTYDFSSCLKEIEIKNIEKVGGTPVDQFSVKKRKTGSVAIFFYLMTWCYSIFLLFVLMSKIKYIVYDLETYKYLKPMLSHVSEMWEKPFGANFINAVYQMAYAVTGDVDKLNVPNILKTMIHIELNANSIDTTGTTFGKLSNLVMYTSTNTPVTDSMGIVMNATLKYVHNVESTLHTIFLLFMKECALGTSLYAFRRYLMDEENGSVQEITEERSIIEYNGKYIAK